MILDILSQSSPTPVDFSDWKDVLLQLGVGFFIAGPFAFLWWDERKQRKELEKQLIDKLSGLVVESTTTLEKVKDAFNQTVEKIAEKSSRLDLDTALRRVEHVADELSRTQRAQERSNDL